mmetsp:Transcript_11244/g.25503  ORF Transcript_11244/g.25503 Transcript_11244/m.25503 type:complete len:127 (+) Transcript_11244:1609-1989(+)
MVEEAEKYKNEDEKTRLKIEAKNNLENYAYNIRNTIRDDKLKDKIDENDKKLLEDKIKEILEYVENNEDLEKENYEEKEKELKNLSNPIISKIYQQNNGVDPSVFSQNNDQAGDNENTGPKIEEVD